MQPNGTEGYRTGVVTLGGGIQTNYHRGLWEALQAGSLYFIGEVMDVTGWLGGYQLPVVGAQACAVWRLSEDNKVVHKALKL